MLANAVPPWLLPLLCCPHCMSALAFDEAEPGVVGGQAAQWQEGGRRGRTGAGWKPALPGETGAGKMPAVLGETGAGRVPVDLGEALRCVGCGRAYPLSRLGAEGAMVPRIKRDDTLATLAQDVVVNRYDPDSAPVAARRRVAWYERRERFLVPLLQNVARPYAVAAARGDAAPVAPSPGEMAALDRFVALLPSDSPVLDLACGTGLWTRRLVARGLCVVGADGSAPSLARAVTLQARPLTPQPPLPQGARGSRIAGSSLPHEGDGGHSASPLPHEGDGGHSDSPLPHEGEGLGVRGLSAFVEAEMMEMPFASASMGGVWCSEAFEYVRPDRRAVFFRQIHRVLRPGGVLFLSAETKPLGAVVRQYLLWRLLFGKPVLFGEYIYRLPRRYRSAWHYHAMTDARTLRALCNAHGFRVLSLRRDRWLWLLLARKEIHG